MCIAALVAGSIGSSLIGASSAKKSASAVQNATDAANETRRYIFDKNVELSEPWRAVGENALAALAFETGIGPRPTFGGGYDGPPIEEIDGGTGLFGGTGGVGIVPRWKDLGKDEGDEQWPVFDGSTRTAGPMYRVGDKTFRDRKWAELYVDRRTRAGTPYGGFKATPGYQFRREEGEQGLERYAAARGMRLSGASLKSAARFNDGLAAQEYGNHYNRLAALSGTGQSAAGQQQAAGESYANAFGQNAIAGGQAQASGIMGVNNAIQGGFNNMFNIFGMKQMGYFD